MTHQSRICAVFFDTESDYDGSRQFWSAALSREAKNDSDEKYTTCLVILKFSFRMLKQLIRA